MCRIERTRRWVLRKGANSTQKFVPAATQSYKQGKGTRSSRAGGRRQKKGVIISVILEAGRRLNQSPTTLNSPGDRGSSSQNNCIPWKARSRTHPRQTESYLVSTDPGAHVLLPPRVSRIDGIPAISHVFCCCSPVCSFCFISFCDAQETTPHSEG